MAIDLPFPPELLGADDERPYVEVVDGVAHEKPVSPAAWHGRIAVRLGAVIDAWAGDDGATGAEVRHVFIPNDGTSPSSLLPDVGYTSFARLDAAGDRHTAYPRIAPDLAIVDPLRNRWTIHTPSETSDGPLSGVVTIPGFDGLEIDWAKILRGITLPAT